MKLHDSLAATFARMRFDKRSHLGLGDIRVTHGHQDEIVEAVRRLEAMLDNVRAWMRSGSQQADDLLVHQMQQYDDATPPGAAASDESAGSASAAGGDAPALNPQEVTP